MRRWPIVIEDDETRHDLLFAATSRCLGRGGNCGDSASECRERFVRFFLTHEGDVLAIAITRATASGWQLHAFLISLDVATATAGRLPTTQTVASEVQPGHATNHCNAQRDGNFAKHLKTLRKLALPHTVNYSTAVWIVVVGSTTGSRKTFRRFADVSDVRVMCHDLIVGLGCNSFLANPARKGRGLMVVTSTALAGRVRPDQLEISI